MTFDPEKVAGYTDDPHYRKSKRLTKRLDEDLTQMGIRHTEYTLRPAQIAGLPKGGLLKVAGGEQRGGWNDAWKAYRKEVEQARQGWVAIARPSARTNSIATVLMTWEEFVTIIALLQEET